MMITSKKGGRQFKGIIVSTKMAKTVVVEVKRYVQHPKYKKYLVRSKRYLAHDETGTRTVGEAVTIQETRPLSRHKSFIIV